MPSATIRVQSIGEALMLLRYRSGLSRDEVAGRAEVATGTLSRYESDTTRKPDMETVHRLISVLARAVGADPSALWSEVGDIVAEQERSRRVLAVRVATVHPPRPRAGR